MKRRSFLTSSAAALAAARFGFDRAAADEKVPVLGLIFPPLDRGIPEEGIAMYGDRLKYVVTGLGPLEVAAGVLDVAVEGDVRHVEQLGHGATSAGAMSHGTGPKKLTADSSR